MPKTESRLETWQQGDAYEPYVGRWSRLVAREFLRWLDSRPGAAWLDVGSGTGALTHAILEGSAPQRVLAIDRSLDYLRLARARNASDRARFTVADACALPANRPAFDIAVSGLVLNFVPIPALMIEGMALVVRPGGQVAVYVWDYAGRMELMRYFWDAAIAVSPNYSKLDQAERFPICQPEPLEALFTDTGLKAVSSRSLEIPTVFRNFDDYWKPFLGKQGAAPTYLASVTEETREKIRARLEARLLPSADGTIGLHARAWAVQGTVASA